MSAPPALMRLRRPRWKDPRLIVGIVLVLISVLLGALLAARISATTTVLVARSDIVVGDPISADSFSATEVRLGDQERLYASSPQQIPEGSTAMQSVRAGELLPVSAIGQGGGADLRPVVIPVDRAVADSVTTGSAVELWRTEEGDGETGAAAELLVEGAIVRSVEEGSSLGMRSQSVEVLVPSASLPAVLEAIAQEDRLDVIGVPGAAGVSP
ncbi:flagellar biosynthesis protein FlgA [Brachybacterium sp. JHP9]|uniref:Flagellar biosynthesis protein FlgA n=1 Tax=Brachybacterium equifaecis TaxID=2910770 RepID=A0ABT0R1Z3_9MICO|nr:flagellar biosynthesis protein FlgA [Brachybacterium equifaecis]MCL6423932.1 flagellar biosynthesis protein FlgA [Brachybacterium equifaecis]